MLSTLIFRRKKNFKEPREKVTCLKFNLTEIHNFSLCSLESETCFPGMINATQSTYWIHFDRIAGGFVNYKTIFNGLLLIGCYSGLLEKPVQDVLAHLGAEGVGFALKFIILQVYSASVFKYICRCCETTAEPSIATDGGDSENHPAPGTVEPMDSIELAYEWTEEKNAKDDWKLGLLTTVCNSLSLCLLLVWLTKVPTQ